MKSAFSAKLTSVEYVSAMQMRKLMLVANVFEVELAAQGTGLHVTQLLHIV